MARRPNIVIFNPDQWRWDVMGHAGNPAAITPNVDALVEQDGATSFAHAYCQNPVCTPSRCSFMTGWYPHVRGHRTMFHLLRAGEPILLRTLKEGGYRVWWGGKNDLMALEQGYESCAHERVFSNAPHSLDKLKPDWRGPLEGDNYHSFYGGRIPAPADGSPYRDGDWTVVESAIDYVRHYDGEEPFCLFLALGYPHPPYAVEEPYYSAIDRTRLPERRPVPTAPGKPAILEGIRREQRLGTWTEERWTELRATYYGMCMRVDDQVGRLIRALKERNLWDDTLFVLMSDHGDYTGDYGLVEKAQNTFEDPLVRVPLVVKPPRGEAAAPGRNDAIVELVDIAATLEDYSGLRHGWRHFGRSLRPLLTGQTTQGRDVAFCEGGRLPHEVEADEHQAGLHDDPTAHYYPRLKLQVCEEPLYHTKASMVCDQRYKYVRRLHEADELYDRDEDPMELVNRIDDPSLARVRSRLAERLLDWYQETCDVVPPNTDRRW